MNRRGVRLGRILGVEIFLHPSWFLLAGLIAFVLGQGFSTGSPSFAGAGAVVLGLMGAVLFFASLLAHELAHSVVAQRKGIPVHRITLFLLGGAAQITREPSTAGDEAKIALAGPALSVVLGVLLLGLGLVADQVGALAGAALFGTLGAINLLLAAFNMLPGFPMDGGRVLRAAIWAGTHDLAKATRIAATAGRVIAIAMIGGGASLALLGALPVNGIWLVLIGCFLYQSAQAAYRQAPAAGLAAHVGMTVGQVMTPRPEWVPTALRLDEDVHRRLGAVRDRAFPVVGPSGRIEGVLTLEGLEAIPRERWATLTAGDAMVPMALEMVASAAEPYEWVVARVAANPAGRFVVLDGGRLVGVLSCR
jgi:Zn-dependent protease